MNESAVVMRTVEVTWGGEQKMLPVLPIDPSDEWRKLFVRKFPETAADELDAAKAMTLAATKLIDLLLNYDRSKVLGTREWIRANVTDDELADAFVEVYRRTFRLSRLPVELTRAMLAPQQPARSPNGRSPTGVLTPINSAADSPTSN